MRLRFSTRLILGVILIEAVMLSALVWNSVRLISSSHEAQLLKNIEAQTRLLAASLQPGLASNDRALLSDALTLLEGNPGIRYVTVTDREGRPMARLGNPPEKLPEPDTRFASAQRDGVYNVRQPVVLYGQTLGTLHIGYDIAFVQDLIDTTRQQNSLIAAAELGLSILLTILLGLYLTRNLRKLELGAEALGREELDHRIDLPADDEIGAVASAFNRLADHLKQTRQTLREEHAALAREKQRMETLLNNIKAVIMEADPATMQFHFVSREAETLLGYPVEDWYRPGFWRQRLHPDDFDWVFNTLQEQTRLPGEYSLDYRLQHHSGEYVWVRCLYSIEHQDERQIIRGLLIDISEQKQTEERIVFLANHDPLTNLYNRRRFQEHLERQIAYARRFKIHSALLFVDLDQFKYINDTLGHQAGDQCLISVAHVFRASLREIDILGRMGGDEFGIILPNVDEQGALTVARNLIDRLEAEVRVPADPNIRLSASIGIALFPEQGTTPAELLAKADAAMYTTKRQGRSRVHVYQPDDRELLNMKAKVHWENRINHALRHDRFLLHYQPIVSLPDHRISHYEVLLRLREENGELIYPGAFLEIAERFGLIRDVDEWVIRNAIAEQARSIRDGLPVTLAINLSGRHFGDPDFVTLVRECLAESQADPARLIFEVTETAAVENLTAAERFIEPLRELGCRLALDDFGVGYSSFHYLKNLPVDMIKIDGSFIRHLHQNRADQAIVRAITDLSRGMDIQTVAEFVENRAILDKLEELGVDYAQGYHIAMPGPDFLHEPDDEASLQLRIR